MRAFVGLLLLCAGLAFGAFSYAPVLLGEPRIAMARAEPEAPAAARPARDARDDGVRIFSPRTPLFAPSTPEPRNASAAAASPQPAAPAVSGVVAEVPNEPVTRPVGGWTTTVSGNRGTSRPADPEARADLIRDIQTELKRVGCYEGEIDGSWGPGSKRAMTTFTDRINATLPIDEPDYILLTLVQGHRTSACGACPVGQSLSDGKCVPKAVVAAATRGNKGRGKADGKSVVEDGDKVAKADTPKAEAGKSDPAKPVRGEKQEAPTVAATAPVVSPVSTVVSPVATLVEPMRPEPVKPIAPSSGWEATVAAIAPSVAAAKPTAAAEAGVTANAAGSPPIVTGSVARAEPTTTTHAPRAEPKADGPPAVARAEPKHEPKQAAIARAEPKAAAVAEPWPVAKPVVVTRAEPEVAASPAPAPEARREPLPGRMTVGGPVRDTPAAPAIAAPVTESDNAKDDDADEERPSKKRAVTAPKAVHAPRPRVVHTPPPPPPKVHHSAPKVQHAPPPRVVHTPPPRPQRYVSAPPSNGGSSASQRQKAMVYNLFQRPDRY